MSERSRSPRECPCGCGNPPPPILLTHSFDGMPFRKPLHLKLVITVPPERPAPLYVGDDYPRIAHRFQEAQRG